MKRALVSGATGFIGAALTKALQAEGWAVQALGRSPAAVETLSFDILAAPPGALRTIIERSGCDTVFHLAGTTSDAEGTLERVNVGFAEAVLEAAARASRRPAVVLAGTAAEYGEVAAADLPAREDHPCRPSTRYGATKLRQTELGLAAAAAGLTVHLPRMFNVIGPGMRPHLGLGRFARDIAALGPSGGVLTTGPLDARRDFVAVAEAVGAVIRLSGLPQAAGQVVNICSGVPLGMTEAVEALIGAAGVPVAISIDRGRSGVSAVPSIYGCRRRMDSLGLRVGVPDLAVEMARLLRDSRARRDRPAGAAG